MREWLISQLPAGWTGWHVFAIAVALSVGTAIISLVLVGYALARLPADYFVNPEARRPLDRHPVMKVILVVAKNLFGYLLIALGAVMSLPGVPGQGLLTILMGVLLIDFPGKHRAERWLLTRRGVLIGINRVRARLGKPPLLSETAARRDEPSA